MQARYYEDHFNGTDYTQATLHTKVISSYPGLEGAGLFSGGGPTLTFTPFSQVLADFWDNDPFFGSDDEPVAYLRMRFFDAQGNELTAHDQLVPVSSAAGFTGVSFSDNGYHSVGTGAVSAPADGYVLVYVANESAVDVFFDDLALRHERRIIQENHYYPFGLNVKALRRLGLPDHQWQYNNIELEASLSLNWNMAKYRTLDPQLGRWGQIDPMAERFYGKSPYNSNFNNPISYQDEDGDVPWLIVAVVGAVTEVGTQMVTNALTGQDVTDIDWGDVGVATLEGAVTGGASAVKRTVVRVGVAVAAEVVKAGVDVKAGEIKMVAGEQLGFSDKSLGEAGTDLATGLAAKGANARIVGKAEKGLDTAKATLKKAEGKGPGGVKRYMRGSDNYHKAVANRNSAAQSVTAAEMEVDIAKNVYSNGVSASANVTSTTVKGQNEVVNQVRGNN